MAAAVVITLDQLPAEFGRAIASMGAVKFQSVGRILQQLAISDTKKRFAASMSPDGTPWVPLRHQRVYAGTSNKPLRNFGFLMASVQAKATQNDMTVSSNLIYAGLHQFGGMVRPKKGKFLAIPATKEASRAGGARRFRRPLHPIINRRGTGGVLLDENDVVQYYLTKEVKVPARPFLGFSKAVIGEIGELLSEVAMRQFTFGRAPGSPDSTPMRTRA